MIELKTLGSTTETKIKDLEKKYNILLPNDYKSFLLKTNGGSAEINDFNQIVIEELPEKIVVDVLYGIDTEHQAANINFWTDKYKSQANLFENTIIIGDSITHGFFVMICSGEMQGIYYWDHTYHYDVSNDDVNTYWVANNFTDFMNIFD